MIVHNKWLPGCGEGFGLCPKKTQKLAGKYSANHIHTSFVLQPTIRRVNIENASQCRGANGQTLLGHVTRRALIIHFLAGKGQRARGKCPATWNSLPGLAYCGGGVDGWSNRHSNNPRQQRPRGFALEQMQKALLHVERAPPQSRITLPALSQPCEAPVLHFLLPKCRQLRRAAAELMHLTKHYLATGISAFTPESLW